MGNHLHNLVIYNGYPLAVVAAVLLHCVLLFSLLVLQRTDSAQELELVQPTVIKSLFIDENPQVVRRQEVERQRLQRIEDQRRAREQEQLRQQREAQAAAEAERQREAREQEARERAALLERQQLERQQRLEREQQQRERAAEERRREEQRLEQQRQAEAQRQREEQARREQEAAAADAARTEFELVQSATALIQQAVQATWSRPPSARNGMRAVLRIAMLPTGEVTDVTIVESSNDPAFDRSAENAVYRAAPFSELQSLPIRVFNQNFRSLSLIFQPEDLLN
jgi:colicin import membrane protein